VRARPSASHGSSHRRARTSSAHLESRRDSNRRPSS